MAMLSFKASKHCEKSDSFQYKLEGGLYLGSLFWCTDRWAYNWAGEGGGLKAEVYRMRTTMKGGE